MSPSTKIWAEGLRSGLRLSGMKRVGRCRKIRLMMPSKTMPTHTVNMAVMVETTKERKDMMALVVLLWDVLCVLVWEER